MKIGVVGLWHLGEVVAVSLAELGHEVVGIDYNLSVIENFKKGVPPLAEPKLEEMLKRHVSYGRLSFTDDFSALQDCQALFLTYDTPVSDEDVPDTSILYQAVESVAPFAGSAKLLVVMSQVPVGTTKKLLEKVKEKNPQMIGEAVYFPENLQLGDAMRCFLQPDRLVVGVETNTAKENMDEIVKNIPAPRLYMNIASAEMSKHALNAFLATSLSFTYNLSDVCEAVGAEMSDVSLALKSDKRIGQAAYLDTSLGFSGGTLMRDLKSLMHIAGEKKLNLPVIAGTLETNILRRRQVVKRLEALLGRPLTGIKIGVLGVTYKPGTATLRRSLALELMQVLGQVGAKTVAFDPQASPEEFLTYGVGYLASDPYKMAEGCQVLMLVTAWPEFMNLDFARFKKHMSEPFLFFDTRNFLKEKREEIHSTGLNYVGLGK
jgi:UDPglucose 6-dehydrogenase